MFERLLRFLALIGGFGLLGLLGLTVVAVIMRKVFNAPLISALDLSQVSLICVVFVSMAYCGLTGGHVAIDLFSSLLPSLTRKITAVFVHATSAIVLGFIAWHTFIRAQVAMESNDATMLLFIPHFPFIIVVATGFSLYACAALILMVRAATSKSNKSL